MNISDAVALAKSVCNSELSTPPPSVFSQLQSAARHVVDWDHVVPVCLRIDLDTVDVGWRAIPGQNGSLQADMLKIRHLHASVTGTPDPAAAVSSGQSQRLDLSTYLDIGLYQARVFHGELNPRDAKPVGEKPNEPERMRETVECITTASRLLRNETAGVYRRIAELESVADKYKTIASQHDQVEHGMELWHTSANMVGIYRMEPFERGLRPYIYWSDETHSWSNNTDIMRKRKAYTVQRITNPCDDDVLMSFPAVPLKRVSLAEWQCRRANGEGVVQLAA